MKPRQQTAKTKKQKKRARPDQTRQQTRHAQQDKTNRPDQTSINQDLKLLDGFLGTLETDLIKFIDVMTPTKDQKLNRYLTEVKEILENRMHTPDNKQDMHNKTRPTDQTRQSDKTRPDSQTRPDQTVRQGSKTKQSDGKINHERTKSKEDLKEEPPTKSTKQPHAQGIFFDRQLVQVKHSKVLRSDSKTNDVSDQCNNRSRTSTQITGRKISGQKKRSKSSRAVSRTS